MAGFLGFLYGLAAYLIFLGTFLYAIGFVTGVAVPVARSSAADAPVGRRVEMHGRPQRVQRRSEVLGVGFHTCAAVRGYGAEQAD